jgi:hypothetical protein
MGDVLNRSGAIARTASAYSRMARAMGTTLYISLDRPVQGLEPNACDRVFLADVVGDVDGLETLSRRLGVPSLANFQSYAAEDMAGLTDGPLPEGPPVEWFDPAVALPALSALAEHYRVARYVRERGRRVQGKWEPVDRTDDLLDELRDCEAVLAGAAAAGARFRFHIGF